MHEIFNDFLFYETKLDVLSFVLYSRKILDFPEVSMNKKTMDNKRLVLYELNNNDYFLFSSANANKFVTYSVITVLV